MLWSWTLHWLMEQHCHPLIKSLIEQTNFWLDDNSKSHLSGLHVHQFNMSTLPKVQTSNSFLFLYEPLTTTKMKPKYSWFRHCHFELVTWFWARAWALKALPIQPPHSIWKVRVSCRSWCYTPHFLSIYNKLNQTYQNNKHFNIHQHDNYLKKETPSLFNLYFT